MFYEDHWYVIDGREVEDVSTKVSSLRASTVSMGVLMKSPRCDPVPQPVKDDFRPQSSAGATFVPPPSPDMRSTPSMRPYVRVSTSLSQTFSRLSCSPLFLYAQDPDDPTTFPWKQGIDHVPMADSPVPEASSTGHTQTTGSMTTFPPPAYHGLQIV
jgi:hypothetical protein